MEKFVPVVVIKELSETDKILTALKNNGINTAEITSAPLALPRRSNMPARTIPR